MKSTVLITGANRGIGQALVQHYLQQGCHVIAVCREASDELKATTANIIEHIDVTNANDLQALHKALAGQSIDILINNAGILCNESLVDMSAERIQQQFQVNALAPLMLTHRLLENLESGAKIALVTSRMGSIADNGSGGYYGYRMSKAALNAAGKSLAQDLLHRGISVAILHPGMVSTRMIGFHGDVEPEQAAAGLAQRIAGLSLQNTGTFWHANGEVLPW